jgi:hypothetical protein
MKLKKQVAVLLGLCALMPVGIAARPHVAYAATVPGTHVAKSCKGIALPLSDAQMTYTTAGNPMDAICWIVSACVTIWPIGTLLCGPTGIGCIIYYYQK